MKKLGKHLMAQNQKQQQSQQDPINLEQLCDGLTSTEQPAEAKAQAVQVLCTVAHHPTVKAILVQQPAVVKAIANGIVQRADAWFDVRWQNLAVIGELCRRENKGDADDFVNRNAVAKSLVAQFAKIPWFVGALKDLAAEHEEENVQTAEIAADLLKVIPAAAKGTNVTANAKLGEEDLGDGFIWSKEQREASKDLMYVDPSEIKQLEYLPFVVRASNKVCGNCAEKSEKVLNRCVQCKAAFYCSASCQKTAWSQHKVVCSPWKKEKSPLVFPGLFYETRAFLFETRPEAMAKVEFYDFFLQYTGKYNR